MNLKDQLLKEHNDMKIWYLLRDEIENKRLKEHQELVEKVQDVITHEYE